MRMILSLATAVLLLGGGGLRADTLSADDDAAAIVRKAIKAHGGEANLAKHMTSVVESEGTVDLMAYRISGIEYTFKAERTARPGRFKENVRVFQTMNNNTRPYTSIHTVYNGEGQIVRDGRSELLREQGLKEFKAQAHHREVCLLTPLIRDAKYKLTVLDREAVVSGKPAVALMVHHEDYDDIVLYFDKESGRLVKSKRSFYHFGHKKEGELLTVYGDFRVVQGALIPHRVVSYHDGKQVAFERVTRIMVLEDAPDEWFRIRE